MMTWFLFVLVALASFRLQRIITSDTWPVSQWFRRGIDARFGPHSGWSELFGCPWCIGFWCSGAVVAVMDYMVGLQWPVLWWFAVSSIVGYLGTYDGS